MFLISSFNVRLHLELMDEVLGNIIMAVPRGEHDRGVLVPCPRLCIPRFRMGLPPIMR